MRVLGVLLGLLATVPAAAQIEFEVRGGAAIGSHSSTLAGLDFQPRVSVEAIGKMDVGGLRTFAAGAFTGFGCTQGFCTGPNTVGITNLALAAGVEASRFGVWARGGLGAGATEIRGSWEIGPAASLAVGGRIGVGWGLALAPGVTYRWMYGGGSQTIMVGAGLGLNYRLGAGR